LSCGRALAPGRGLAALQACGRLNRDDRRRRSARTRAAVVVRPETRPLRP